MIPSRALSLLLTDAINIPQEVVFAQCSLINESPGNEPPLQDVGLC